MSHLTCGKCKQFDQKTNYFCVHFQRTTCRGQLYSKVKMAVHCGKNQIFPISRIVNNNLLLCNEFKQNIKHKMESSYVSFNFT